MNFCSSIRRRCSRAAPLCCWARGRCGCWSPPSWSRRAGLGYWCGDAARAGSAGIVAAWRGVAAADSAGAVLLLMLWHPALSVATLRPQQNIVAVVVDDSASMGRGRRGRRRHPASGRSECPELRLLNSLQDKFQVRLYRMSDHLERFDKLDQLTSTRPPRISATASSKSWRMPPACPSVRWCWRATARTTPAAWISKPCPRSGVSAFRFTPSGSAARRCRARTSRSATCRFPRARFPIRGWRPWCQLPSARLCRAEG